MAASKAGKALTIRQERFCRKFIECGNASEAYRHAYSCDKTKPGVVNVKASELLAKGAIVVRVSELRTAADKAANISRDEILGMLSDAIRADVTDFVTPDGIIRTTDIRKMPIAQRRLIEKIEATKDGCKITLMAKNTAIERLAKMCGWDAPSQAEVRLANELDKYSDEELAAMINGGK